MFPDSNSLYTACYHTVRSWPVAYDAQGHHIKCKSLNSFAVLQNQAQLNQGALGKEAIRYQGKSLFYSRTWEAGKYEPQAMIIDYPALVMIVDSTKLDTSKQYKERQVMLMVLDHMPGKDGSQHRECGLRTLEDVMENSEYLLAQFIQELKHWYVGKTTLGVDVLLHASEANGAKSVRQCLLPQQIELTTLVGQFNADLVSSRAMITAQIKDCRTSVVNTIKGSRAFSESYSSAFDI